MSNYCFNPTHSYGDWLTAKRFVRNITDGQEAVELTVSRQTREIVASLDELARENITAIEDLAGDVREGFERLEFGLADVSAGIRELNAQFHWGFTEMIAGIGRLNDSLQELISIAKTPAQTWAYNQYEIARDAIRRRLWPEALQALDRAINGLGDHPGYPLEFRFHHSKGMIYLGNFRNADPTVVNLPKAEEAFLAAARYARADYPLEAGMSFLTARWAAYCQGKMVEAQAHTTQAITHHSRLGEAFFQLAKVAMHRGSPSEALPNLRSAIELDHLYAVKSLADGDFQGHEVILRSFLDQMRGDVFARADQAIQNARSWTAALKKWRDLAAVPNSSTDPASIEREERASRVSALLETAVAEQTQKSLLASLRSEKLAAETIRLARAIIEELRARVLSTARGFLDQPTTREHAPNAARAGREALAKTEEALTSALATPQGALAGVTPCESALRLAQEARAMADDRVRELAEVATSNKVASGVSVVGAIICLILYVPTVKLLIKAGYFGGVDAWEAARTWNEMNSAQQVISIFFWVGLLACLPVTRFALLRFLRRKPPPTY